MSGCGKCCGSCGNCGEIVLSQGEIKMLQTLWQIPFLPVARKANSLDPVYLEDSEYSPEEYSSILQCLEKRGLIAIKYGTPLKGCDLCTYEKYPIMGSFALTDKGQAVAELIELQGISQEK